MSLEPYSREYFAAILDPDVIADIHRRAAAAPDPTPEKVAQLRRIFAPAVARLTTGRPAESRRPALQRAA